MNKILKVKGMHCKSCEMLLKDSVSEINGISVGKIDYKKGLMEVSFPDAPALEKVKKTITKEGYTVE